MGCLGGRDANGEKKCTLQTRAKVAAVVDMVLAIIGLTVNGIDLRKQYNIKDDDTKTEEEKLEADRAAYLVMTIIVINCIKFLMGYILWTGATQKISKRCKIWQRVSIALWLIHLTDFVVRLIVGTFVLSSTIITSLELLGRIFPLTIVTLFIRQLAQEKKARQQKPYGTPVFGLV